MARSKAVAVENEKAPKVPSKNEVKANPIKYYLIAYNALSALAWSYVLITTIAHLSGLTAYSKLSAPTSASSTAFKFLSYLPFIKKSMPLASQFQAKLPAGLVPLYTRATTLWGAVGPQTTWIQTAAILEILHVLFGWVRSPLQTTAMQVASRFYAVWVVLEFYEVARSNPLVATMYLAWSTTEVLRYSYYVFSLLPSQEIPYPLLWLRYTTFHVLYPLGAGSEAFLNYSTLPSGSPVPSTMKAVIGRGWLLTDYARALLFFVWWPSLYVLYTHMMKQRKKVLGSGGGRKFKAQ